MSGSLDQLLQELQAGDDLAKVCAARGKGSSRLRRHQATQHEQWGTRASRQRAPQSKRAAPAQGLRRSAGPHPAGPRPGSALLIRAAPALCSGCRSASGPQLLRPGRPGRRPLRSAGAGGGGPGGGRRRPLGVGNLPACRHGRCPGGPRDAGCWQHGAPGSDGNGFQPAARGGGGGGKHGARRRGRRAGGPHEARGLALHGLAALACARACQRGLPGWWGWGLHAVRGGCLWGCQGLACTAAGLQDAAVTPERDSGREPAAVQHSVVQCGGSPPRPSRVARPLLSHCLPRLRPPARRPAPCRSPQMRSWTSSWAQRPSPC